ncbi:uncharacterized protein LOC111889145 [Lactuca sativa]|uniref:uncharacterized protein LOC111889145 n=1 Tax=Lactuca sativa TaxID=4236 RepID=UPI000CD9EB62|nr:uncharacterized protein LOC111889145 [Lactuca sativa]
MGDIVTSIRKLESHGKLPSQTEKNPNVNVVTLRSGKQTGENSSKKPREEEEETEIVPIEYPVAKNDTQVGAPKKTIPLVTPVATHPPFPSRLATSKNNMEEKEILDTFRKVEVNIPLLDAIKQIPRYEKFLKELCTNKRKLKGNEKISMNENAYAVLQRKLPPKYKDPGMFTVPCKIGDVTFSSAMLDLGASINVMPYSVYESLNVGPLSETGVIISLAAKWGDFPRGVLEDVLVQTARTKIDVYAGSLTMEFDSETISCNIYDAMRYPSDVSSLCFIDVVEPLNQELFKLCDDDMLEMILEIKKTTQFSLKQIELPQTHTRLPPSLVQPPELELKVLPEHLKYAYLGDNETLPVIISTHLTKCEEEQLLKVLRQHKEAMVWTIADIKGLSPSTCMHKILMEDECKLSRDTQRRLNPPMMEVVKKEILKLLDAGMIYPISDSKWVSPIQVVPKKTGITVVKNNKGVMVLTHVQNG